MFYYFLTTVLSSLLTVFTLPMSQYQAEYIVIRSCSIVPYVGRFLESGELLGEYKGYGNVSSLQECAEWCMNEKNKCQSVSYMLSSEICVLHRIKVDPNFEFTSLSLRHQPDSIYAAFYCGETEKMFSCHVTKYEGIRYHINNAYLNHGFKGSSAECVQQCAYRQNSCKGVTYDRLEKWCTFHSVVMTRMNESAYWKYFSEHYVHSQVDCVSKIGSCKVMKYEGVSYKGAEITTDLKTLLWSESLENCAERCLAYYQPCFGVNYLKLTKTCLLLTSGLTNMEMEKGAYSLNPFIIHGSIKCDKIQTPSNSVGCGTQAPEYYPNFNHRIINGLQAKPHSWPWQIRLVTHAGFFVKTSCGGSLLRVKHGVEKSDVVLTAAHCVMKFKIAGEEVASSEIYVVAGDHHIKKFESGEQRSVSRKTISHPSYTRKPIFNDIALVFLNESLIFSDTVRPVCLPKQNEAIPVGRLCVSTGWGRNDSKNTNLAPHTLQQVFSTVYKANSCELGWRKNYDQHTMICAGDGKSGTCMGDSGGPLQCCEADGSWTLYGLTSYTVKGKCVHPRHPPVYTRVSSYIPWISEMIRRYSKV